MKAAVGIRIVAWCASILGLGLFGYSMTQQTNIQLHMNRSMSALNGDVKATVPLVGKTVQALGPLTATTSALAQIELQEQKTVQDLATMNQHLQQIGVSEQAILSGMTAVYSATSGVNQSLQGVISANGGILSSSQSAASTASVEASRLGQMNQQTAAVISQLHQLNTKLAALKLVP
jgi:hypothetical protein